MSAGTGLRPGSDPCPQALCGPLAVETTEALGRPLKRADHMGSLELRENDRQVKLIHPGRPKTRETARKIPSSPGGFPWSSPDRTPSGARAGAWTASAGFPQQPERSEERFSRNA